MGIHGLAKLLADQAPSCLRTVDIKQYFGRKVAIDASMALYQFLIAVRSADGGQLADEAGNTTSHLMGILYRTIRMLEAGIKPLYVFDGLPPDMKRSQELAKRAEKRATATADLAEAEEAGGIGDAAKFTRRLVRVTEQHTSEAKRLLSLMGVPFVEAPGEAEAQCAALAAAGVVYATASEDMDTLTFGCPLLLRHLTASEAKKLPISELSLQAALDDLAFDLPQFVDLCILLGCDYCPAIHGVGPRKALALVQQHGSIEAILAFFQAQPEGTAVAKFVVPSDWQYAAARQLFLQPSVLPADSVPAKWANPDAAGLLAFLAKEKNFAEERVKSCCNRLAVLRQRSSQGRMDSFIKQIDNRPPATKQAAKAAVLSNKKQKNK